MGSLASLVTFYKDLVTAAHMHNGIVRTAEFMGDRVLQKNYRTKDERIHGLGRYIRVSLSSYSRWKWTWIQKQKLK